MRKLAIAAVAALLAVPIVAAAESMTAQQYHKDRGPCACPNDKDKAGKNCGKRSAFCQSGSVEISNCYTKDAEKKKKEACG